jgi:predicted nicotinamide N-methyase
MQRGAVLRRLRQLDLEDEAARAYEETATAEIDNLTNIVDMGCTKLNDGGILFSYESFLSAQKFYDDLKHINYRFLDYGTWAEHTGSGRLIIEQDKHLGKGGLCWDAAFILGEYLIHKRARWQITREAISGKATRVLELGSGTGLAGIMVAKVVRGVQLDLTDLPSLMPLLRRNVARNFESSRIVTGDANSVDDSPALPLNRAALGKVATYVLDWGQKDFSFSAFDVIIGADVVASLYDPIALVKTIHTLSNEKTAVYISFKERLSTIHRQFEEAMQTSFATVHFETPTCSRNRNPNVRILIARHKYPADRLKLRTTDDCVDPCIHQPEKCSRDTTKYQ